MNGSKEYDVFVLVRHRAWWWPWRVTYTIVLGQSFATAADAAAAAQLRVNAGGGRAIGIAADALVCCSQTDAPQD